jgi:hypothetical protein
MLENCPEILEVCGAIRLTEVYLNFTFYLFIFSLLSAMISSSSCAFLFSPIFLPLCFLFCGVGSHYVPWLRNLVCRLVVALTYPHRRKTDEVRGKVVREKSLPYMVMAPEKVTHRHCCL